MSEVDYVRLLRSEFERQSFEKCLGIALRVILADFPEINTKSNGALSEGDMFRHGRVLLQSVVFWRFQCTETRTALRKSACTGFMFEPPESNMPVYLAARAALLETPGKAYEAVENALAMYSSAYIRQQHPGLFNGNQVVNSAEIPRAREIARQEAGAEIENPLSKVYLSDFELETDKLFNRPIRDYRPSSIEETSERKRFTAFYDSPIHSFWQNWRQGFIDGKPLDWELQRRVALIDDSIWKAGPEAVAAEIAKVEKKWLATRPFGYEAPLTENEVSKVTHSLTHNRDAIVVSTVGLIEQIESFREKVRGLNALEPDVREETVEFANYLVRELTGLIGILPKPDEQVSIEKSGRVALWLRKYNSELLAKLAHYSSPENVAEATVPTSIVLISTGIGAMLGQPLAGAAVGGLISNQMKPGQAAKDLLKGSENER